MAIHFKFKSAKEFNSINIDGHFITVASLRERIIDEKNLGKGMDFDLLIVDAHSGEEYKDDSYQVPRNSSVILIRVPASRTKTSIQVQEDSKMTSVNYESSYVEKPIEAPNTFLQSVSAYPPSDGLDDFGDFYSAPTPTTAPISTNAPASKPSPTPMVNPMEEEEQKINAMLEKSALEWQRPSTEPPGGRGRGLYGRGMERGRNLIPPVGYVCHRCGLLGHFIQYCPTNGDPRYDIKRVKPPSGIPRTKLRQDETGSYILPDGSVAVMQPDESGFQKVAETLPSARITIAEPPSELRCPLCKTIFKDAVMIPCCHFSFCDQCIRQALISGGKCPQCASTKYKNDDLLPNMSLRQAIEKFKESQVASTSAEEGVTKHGTVPIAVSAALPGQSQSKPEVSDNLSSGSGSKQKSAQAPEKASSGKKEETSLSEPKDVAEEPALKQDLNVSDIVSKPEEKEKDEDEDAEEVSLERGKDENQENEASNENMTADETKEKDTDKLNAKKKKKKSKTQQAEAVVPEPAPLKQKKGDRKCFQCGSSDHMIRECPEAQFNQNMFHQGMFPPVGPTGFPPYPMGGNFWGGPFGPVPSYPGNLVPSPMGMYGYGEPMGMPHFEGPMIQPGPFNPNVNPNMPHMYPGGHPNLMPGNFMGPMMGGQDGFVGVRPMLPHQTQEDFGDKSQKRQVLEKRKIGGGHQDRLIDTSENRSISETYQNHGKRDETEASLSKNRGRRTSPGNLSPSREGKYSDDKKYASEMDYDRARARERDRERDREREKERDREREKERDREREKERDREREKERDREREKERDREREKGRDREREKERDREREKERDREREKERDRERERDRDRQYERRHHDEHYKSSKERKYYEGKNRDHDVREDYYYEDDAGRKERRDGRDEEDRHRHHHKSSEKHSYKSYDERQKYDKSYKHLKHDHYEEDYYTGKYERKKHGDKERYDNETVENMKVDSKSVHDAEKRGKKDKSKDKGSKVSKDPDSHSVGKEKLDSEMKDAMEVKHYEQSNDTQLEISNVETSHKRKDFDDYHEDVRYSQDVDHEHYGDDKWIGKGSLQNERTDPQENKDLEADLKSSKESETTKPDGLETSDSKSRERIIHVSEGSAAVDERPKKRKSKSKGDKPADGRDGDEKVPNREKDSKSSKSKSSKSEEGKGKDGKKTGDEKHRSKKKKKNESSSVLENGVSIL